MLFKMRTKNIKLEQRNGGEMPNAINVYFQSINTDPNYSAPQLLEIPKGTRIPSLSIDIVHNFLRKQKRSSFAVLVLEDVMQLK